MFKDVEFIKYKRARRLARFLGVNRFRATASIDLYHELAARGWRWDSASYKWIHANNHPEEIGEQS